MSYQPGPLTPGQVKKALVALLVSVVIVAIQAAQSALGDGVWTTEDTLVTVAAALAPILVFVTRNDPPGTA